MILGFEAINQFVPDLFFGKPYMANHKERMITEIAV